MKELVCLLNLSLLKKYLPGNFFNEGGYHYTFLDDLKFFFRVMIRFLLQVVGIVVSEIQTLSFIPAVNTTETHFLCEQLAHLLLYMSHMFQSGD